MAGIALMERRLRVFWRRLSSVVVVLWTTFFLLPEYAKRQNDSDEKKSFSVNFGVVLRDTETIQMVLLSARMRESS